jgi:hypothetical protein
MQAVLFKWHRRAAMIAVLALAFGAALAFALLSSGTGPAQAKVHHAKHQVHHARHHSATSDQPGSTDPDTVQSGDQTTPDTSGAAPGESTGSGESSVETEQGQPGEPANGHQDTGSGAGSDCTGNCVQ